MLTLRRTKAFEKDLKLASKRGKNVSKLEVAITLLQQEEPLPASYKAHPLKGDWKPAWECHLEFNWLLVYKIVDDELVLVRTGTHDDLFKR